MVKKMMLENKHCKKHLTATAKTLSLNFEFNTPKPLAAKSQIKVNTQSTTPVGSKQVTTEFLALSFRVIETNIPGST